MLKTGKMIFSRLPPPPFGYMFFPFYSLPFCFEKSLFPDTFSAYSAPLAALHENPGKESRIKGSPMSQFTNQHVTHRSVTGFPN